MAKYLIEISCVEWRLVGTVPSLIAAAGIWLARLVLDCDDEWTPRLEKYMQYTKEALIPTANIMLDFVLQPNCDEYFFFRKYVKASKYVRKWAISLWGREAGRSARLEDYLDRLKMEQRRKAAAQNW
jgi:G2/mitotic-specific cyclin 1/2